MIVSKGSLKTYVSLCFVVMLVSFFVAVRELDVGTDTKVYVSYFIDLAAGNDVVQLEYGFYFLSLILSSTGLPFEINFFVFSVFNFLFASWFVSSLSSVEGDYHKFVLFFIVCLFVNPFFVGFQVNAVRQGLSIFLLLLSLSFLMKHCFLKFAVVYLA
ncbi:EpsG family protein, partial [Shewanella sp. BJSY2023SW001]|uniref:EpsG family protein n=1 Tax=Shewanella sp. BJSY2023SW001 TaxID=3392039 RepID=UPI0039B39FA6